MNQQEIKLSEKLLRKKHEQPGKQQQPVAHHFAARAPIAQNVTHDISEQMTSGQGLADKVASFGGSWTFISLFAAVMVAWILLNSLLPDLALSYPWAFLVMVVWILGNSLLLVRFGSKAFDPYPLRNLFVSMLAAIQAPIIRIYRNRQADKDRLMAEHEVNLKSELEVMTLHEKIDSLREQQWGELIIMQTEQLRLLNSLIEARKPNQMNGSVKLMQRG